MKKVDMSDKAISRRLKQVDQMARAFAVFDESEKRFRRKSGIGEKNNCEENR